MTSQLPDADDLDDYEFDIYLSYDDDDIPHLQQKAYQAGNLNALFASMTSMQHALFKRWYLRVATRQVQKAYDLFEISYPDKKKIFEAISTAERWLYDPRVDQRTLLAQSGTCSQIARFLLQQQTAARFPDVDLIGSTFVAQAAGALTMSAVASAQSPMSVRYASMAVKSADGARSVAYRTSTETAMKASLRRFTRAYFRAAYLFATQTNV